DELVRDDAALVLRELARALVARVLDLGLAELGGHGVRSADARRGGLELGLRRGVDEAVIALGLDRPLELEVAHARDDDRRRDVPRVARARREDVAVELERLLEHLGVEEREAAAGHAAA